MRRVGCATSVASEQDKHEDRLDDPNMRVSAKPDNGEEVWEEWTGQAVEGTD